LAISNSADPEQKLAGVTLITKVTKNQNHLSVAKRKIA